MARKLLLLALYLSCAAAQDEEAGEDGGFKSENAQRRDEASKYVYCMEDNCYELLGVKRTSVAFAIKRAYRKFAAEWHPDKNPDPRAKEIFQKYTNAYEVLSSTEMRKNYDYLLDHPIEFPMHYMRFGSGSYAPKTDARIALALCIVLISLMQYVYQKQRRDNLIRAVKTTRQYQTQLKMMIDEMALAEAPSSKSSSSSGKARQAPGSAKAGKKGGSGSEELKAAAEAALLEEMSVEFGDPPSVQNTLLFSVGSTARYLYQVLTGEPTTATRRALALSAFDWSRMSEEDKAELVGKELWKKENLEAYLGETGAVAKPKKGKKAEKRKKGPGAPEPVE